MQKNVEEQQERRKNENRRVTAGSILQLHVLMTSGTMSFKTRLKWTDIPVLCCMTWILHTVSAGIKQITYEYSVWMNMLCVKTWRPSSTTATIHPSLIIKMLWRLIKENKSISITTYCNTNQISDHVIHFHQQRKSNIWAKNCQIQTWKIARSNPLAWILFLPIQTLSIFTPSKWNHRYIPRANSGSQRFETEPLECIGNGGCEAFGVE